MFRLKIFMLAGIILGLCAQYAWADSIDQVVLQAGNPMSVEVSGTLAGCSERDMTSLTTAVDSLYLIQLFAEPQPAGEICEVDGMGFTESFSLPVNTEFTQIMVLLYTVNPDDQVTVLQDSATLTYDVTSLTCSPDRLNINSNGNWVTCTLNLYDGYALEDVDVSSIYLNGTIPADNAVIEDDTMKLKFSREALIADITADETVVFPMVSTLTVTGALLDGTAITASDTIRVIDPPVKKQKKNQKRLNNRVKAKKQLAL